MDRLRLVHRDTLSCEPILRRMPSGELLILAQCGDVTEPAPGNRVYAFHSGDEGETWSKGRPVYPEDGQAVYLTEVTVLAGVVRVYLTLHNGSFLNWRGLVMRSLDSGYTWEIEGPAPCLSTFTFLRGQIRARNGELLMAYQHYPVTAAENERLLALGLRWKDADVGYVESGVLVSGDEGRTYERFPGVRLTFGGDTGRGWIWSEPTLASLPDGAVVMLLRENQSARLWRAESRDYGRTWTRPVMTDIPNPSNKPKLVELPGDRIALIHTPNGQVGMDHRNPLSIWISDDGMKTWGVKHVVTDFPGSFCYADGFYEDGRLLFSIEYNRHDILFVDCAVDAL